MTSIAAEPGHAALPVLELPRDGVVFDSTDVSHHTESSTSEGSSGFIDEKQPQQDSKPAQADPNLVDFDGDDDPANPRNWTAVRKWTLLALISTMDFITPLGAIMFAPSMPSVLADFNTSYASSLSTFIVSVFGLGYILGPLIIAPLSEMYGRLGIFHVCNILFTLFTAACALSTSLSMLATWRFFSGAAGSATLTLAPGFIADLFAQEHRGLAMAVYSAGRLMGPVVGPIIGGAVGAWKGWRAVPWVLVIAAGAVIIPLLVLLRETYAPTLLERKAAKLRKETGNAALRGAHHSDESPAQRMQRCAVRPFKFAFLVPVVGLLALYESMFDGYVYVIFTTITDFMTAEYGIPEKTVGLTYLGVAVGMFIALAMFGAFSDKYLTSQAAKSQGALKPEFRLPPLLLAGVFLPAGMFLYGWTLEKHEPWIVPIVGTGFAGNALMLTSLATQAYLIDAFPLHEASATAVVNVVDSIVGAVLPLGAPSLYQNLGQGWGNSVLAFVAVGLYVIPIGVVIFGGRMREAAKKRVRL